MSEMKYDSLVTKTTEHRAVSHSLTSSETVNKAYRQLDNVF